MLDSHCLQRLCEAFPLCNWKQLEKKCPVSSNLYDFLIAFLPSYLCHKDQVLILIRSFTTWYRTGKFPLWYIPKMYSHFQTRNTFLPERCPNDVPEAKCGASGYACVRMIKLNFSQSTLDFCLWIRSLCMMSIKQFHEWWKMYASIHQPIYGRPMKKWSIVQNACLHVLSLSFQIYWINQFTIWLLSRPTNHCVSRPIQEWGPLNPWSSRLPIIHRLKTKHPCVCSLYDTHLYTIIHFPINILDEQTDFSPALHLSQFQAIVLCAFLSLFWPLQCLALSH